MAADIEDLANLAGRELDHRYILDKFIDRGGFGAVYQGRDQKFSDSSIDVVNGARPADRPFSNSTVAIKVGLSVREFMKEAKLAHEVEHENIVRVKDYGCDDGLAYLVMEFLHGEDLEKLFRKQGNKLTDDQLRKFVSEVGDALAHAHACGLIHRDLKPRNIFIKEGRRRTGDTATPSKFVLVDFGIASRFNTKGTLANVTQKGAGTVEYMAPELLKENPNSTVLSDIYAFGVLLYQMMGGQVPFPQSDSSMLALTTCVTQICNSSPPSLAELARDRRFPESVIAVVMQCLEKDPAKRPSTIAEVRERFLAGMQPVTANRQQTIRPDDVPRIDSLRRWNPDPPPTPHPPRTPWGWVLITVSLLIGFVVFAGQSIFRDNRGSTPSADLFDGQNPVDDGATIEWGVEKPKTLLFLIDNLPKNSQVKFEEIKHPSFTIKQSEGQIPNASQVYELSVTDLSNLPKEASLTLSATASGSKRVFQKKINITLQLPEPWLPNESSRKFRPTVDARLIRVGTRIYASVLECELAGRAVRFRLIPGRTIKKQTIETFYIMERLVTNEMFRMFANEVPGVRAASGSPDASAPAASVTVLEAQQFSRWLAPNYGNLPTAIEWDVAAGYYEFLELVSHHIVDTNKDNNDIIIDNKWDGEYSSTPLLGNKVFIGAGPTKCRFRDGDSEQRECSPYGCFFDQRLKSGNFKGQPYAELTGSLVTEEDLRESCPSGKPSSSVKEKFRTNKTSACVRALNEQDYYDVWLEAAADGQQVAGRKVVAQNIDDKNAFFLVGSSGTCDDETGFRVVLTTSP